MTKATSTSSWKKGAAPQELKVPSGNVALVRRKPLDAFIRQGRIPNSLVPALRKAIMTKGKGDPMEDMDWTPERLADVMDLIDEVVVDCVVEPEVLPEPTCVTCDKKLRDHGEAEHSYREERDSDKLYVDEVDFDDKGEILQFATLGVESKKSADAQSAGDVEPVSGGEDVEQPSEQPAGDPG